MQKMVNCVLALLISMMPLTVYYQAPFLFSELSTLIALMIFLLVIIKSAFFSRGKLYLDKNGIRGLLFAIWMIIVSFFSFLTYLDPGEVINSLIFVLAILLICVFIQSDNQFMLIFSRVYRLIAIVCIGLYLFQLLMFSFGGTAISFKLPFKLSETYISAFDYQGLVMSSVQLSSLFSEKAHFCIYILPLLIISLYDSGMTQRQRQIISIVLTIIIISTASGSGIFCSVLVWIVYFFQTEESKKLKARKTSIFIVFTCIIVLTHFFMLKKSPQYFNTVTRLFSSNVGSSKADYRIYRGFEAFAKIPFFNKIVGIGYRGYTSFSTVLRISTRYDIIGVSKEYFSAFFQLIIYFGLVGLFIVFPILVSLYRSGSTFQKNTLITYLALCIAASIFLDSFFLLFFVFITHKEKGEINYEKTRTELHH